MSQIFNVGDRVMWQYVHATSRITRFERVKIGTFIREVVPHRWGGTARYCLVHFEGNKNPSKVLLRELRSAQ